jgi:hypothetical protein
MYRLQGKIRLVGQLEQLQQQVAEALNRKEENNNG